MKRSQFVVPWREGLHLRVAARLTRLAGGFRSRIELACSGRVADLRSILSVLALCATMGAVVDVEVHGDDETEAVAAIEEVFSAERSVEPPREGHS